MTDDLRTRIATVIRREVPCHPPAADRIAREVIRELGLRLQRDIDGDNEPRGLQPQHRYVTDWVLLADDTTGDVNHD